MKGKELKDQFEDLFADITPEPEAEEAGETLLGEVVDGLLEEEAVAEAVAAEPVVETPAPAPPEPEVEEQAETLVAALLEGEGEAVAEPVAAAPVVEALAPVPPEPEAEEEAETPVAALLEGEGEAVAEPVAAAPVVEALAPVPPEPEAEEEAETLVAALLEGEDETMVEPAAAAPAVAEVPPGEPEVFPPGLPTWEVTIREQRARILNILLTAVSVIATIVVATLVIFSLGDPKLWGTYVPFFIAWAVLVGLALARRVNPTLRTTILVVLAYVAGTLSLVIDGPLGSGGLYLLLAPLLFSVLVQQRAGVYAAVVSFIIYVALAIGHRLGVGGLQPAGVLDPKKWDTVLNLSATFGMMVVTATLIQWMFTAFLTSALREAEERHAEALDSQKLLRERADELTAANVLLQRRTLELETAAQISRAAASVLDPGELMERAVNLTRDRFGLYYVGLFLADESGKQAVLQTSAGEVDHSTTMPGYSLKVGGASAIGKCMADVQTFTALDVSEEPVYFRELLPPETRSEIALPLRARGRVIGALDVHSTEREAFSQEGIAALQSIADQLAVAIDNAQLFAETRERLEEAEASQRLYVRQRWADLVPRQTAPVYERTRPDVAPLDDAMLPDLQRAMTQREVVVTSSDPGDGADRAALVAPITLRGEVIGTLGLQETEGGRQWTADEVALIQAVADQMALAIENVRLIEETQRRAAREQMLGEMTTRFTQSLDLDTLLRAAVRELGQLPNVAEASVHVGTLEEPVPTGEDEETDQG
jgi:GAF domain-containing protein